MAAPTTTPLDPAPEGMEYACGVCGGPTRTDLDRRARYCDLHPDTRAILRVRTVPPLCWELDREQVTCPQCDRQAVWVLLHPPIPSMVLVVIDVHTDEVDSDGCARCGHPLPIPARFEDVA